MISAFVQGGYAAARRHLARARVAQRNAILFGLDVYRAGPRAKKARRLQKEWHIRREMELAEVLRIRRQIRLLRAEQRACLTHQTMMPLERRIENAYALPTI